MSVKLIFSFDSEDYETPAADDAEKWWAETMTRHGITACICVVGELARALRERGRTDVIAAMARHEIAFHSDKHSIYPTWAEYLDALNWEDGVARVLRAEADGIADVAEVFGQYPAAWCKPGASWGPPVAQAMREMDIPVFCDSPFLENSVQPLWMGNTLFLAYRRAFDHFFHVPHAERLENMKAAFTTLLAQHEGGYLIFYTHPCRLVTSCFTDTFTGGKNPDRDEWHSCPLRPEQEIQELKEDFDQFLDWVMEQPGIELTTYRALYRAHAQPTAPWLPLETVLGLCATASEVNYQALDTEYLSPAEQFGVIAHTMAVFARDGRLPEQVPVRRLLGPTAPLPKQATPITVSVDAFLKAARWVDACCTETRSMPSAIPIGHKVIRPNAFLQAAARFLQQAAEIETRLLPDAKVEIAPAPEHPAIVARDDFRNLHFHNTWSEFSPDFEGLNVLETIRRQAWSAKPAVAR